jgi:hypothetical protein
MTVEPTVSIGGIDRTDARTDWSLWTWLRLAVTCSIGMLLIFLIVTKSLPDALAVRATDWALWLNPDHPVALLKRTDELRAEWIARAPKLNITDTSPSSTLPKEQSAERERLRQEIRTLAIRIVRSDPLNAKALRVIAEVTEDPILVRTYMSAAVQRSRRETQAVFWLLNDSFVRKDFASALRYADSLLRTRPQLSTYSVAYMGEMISDPAARALMVKLLAQNPPWRKTFFALLPQAVRDWSLPQTLMLDLAALKSPPDVSELKPYLDALIANNQADIAYYTWLQFLQPQQLAKVSLVNNSGFETAPSGLPFDWIIGRGANLTAGIAEPPGIQPRASKGRALNVAFATGRAQFPEIGQTVVMSPGRYRLTGQALVEIFANRGLRWRIICSTGQRQRLAETDMFLGLTRGWTEFQLEFDVPNDPACQSQRLLLIHDARSASEELAKGLAWFDDIKLTFVPNAVGSKF